jgi:hypothetical protein
MRRIQAPAINDLKRLALLVPAQVSFQLYFENPVTALFYLCASRRPDHVNLECPYETRQYLQANDYLPVLFTTLIHVFRLQHLHIQWTNNAAVKWYMSVMLLKIARFHRVEFLFFHSFSRYFKTDFNTY